MPWPKIKNVWRTSTIQTGANTSGSTGVYAPYHGPPTLQKVRFGADRFFCNKNWSIEANSTAFANVCEDYGDPADWRWMSLAEGCNRCRDE